MGARLQHVNPLLVVGQRLEANAAALIINRPARRRPQRHVTLPRRGEALPERRRRSSSPCIPGHDFKTPRRPRRPRVGLGRRLRPVRERRAQSRIRAVDGREAGRGQLGTERPRARGRRPRRARLPCRRTGAGRHGQGAYGRRPRRAVARARRWRRRCACPSLRRRRPGARRRRRLGSAWLAACAGWPRGAGLAFAQWRPRRIHRC